MAEPVQRERYASRPVPHDLSDTLRRYLTLEMQSVSRAIAPRRREAYGTSAPTTGTFSPGDVTFNLNPVEAGAPGSKYTIQSWIYTAAGSWLEQRALTGN